MGSGPTTVAGEGGPGRYRFGGILVDTAAHTLSRDGHDRPLEPKAFAVLVHLLAHHGELVSRDQLLDAVWGHRHVTPGVLTRAIAQLRTAMDDDPHHPRYIQTQHALGYRFIAALEAESEAGMDARAAPARRRALPEPGNATPSTVPPAKRERRSADRLAHQRWLLLAVLLALVLAVLVGAVIIQPDS